MRIIPLLSVLTLTIVSISAHAEDKKINLTARDGVWEPSTLEVPAGEKFELVVKNEGHEAEEFESVELKREKIIPPGKTITVKLGPLKPGTYGFFGCFHPETARGTISAK